MRKIIDVLLGTAPKQKHAAFRAAVKRTDEVAKRARELCETIEVTHRQSGVHSQPSATNCTTS